MMKPIDEEQGELEIEADEEESAAAKATPYITQAGAEKLKTELRQLLTVERPKVTAEVSFAASLGDRSENAEYIYGKKRLREIDRRLRFLQKRLEKLTVVDPRDRIGENKVYFGATVTLENEDTGARVTYQLVGPDEIDLKHGRISIDSPVGRAVVGKQNGDSVIVNRPLGEIEFKILAVKYVSTPA